MDNENNITSGSFESDLILPEDEIKDLMNTYGLSSDSEYETDKGWKEKMERGILELNEVVESSPAFQSLLTELQSLKERLKKISLDAAIKETGLDKKVVEPILEKVVVKKFRLNRPPFESEIREAKSKTKSMFGAARYLGICPTTLRVYCKLYDRDKTHPFEPLWKGQRGPASGSGQDLGLRAWRLKIKAEMEASGSIKNLLATKNKEQMGGGATPTTI